MPCAQVHAAPSIHAQKYTPKYTLRPSIHAYRGDSPALRQPSCPSGLPAVELVCQLSSWFVSKASCVRSAQGRGCIHLRCALWGSAQVDGYRGDSPQQVHPSRAVRGTACQPRRPCRCTAWNGGRTACTCSWTKQARRSSPTATSNQSLLASSPPPPPQLIRRSATATSDPARAAALHSRDPAPPSLHSRALNRGGHGERSQKESPGCDMRGRGSRQLALYPPPPPVPPVPPLCMMSMALYPPPPVPPRMRMPTPPGSSTAWF